MVFNVTDSPDIVSSSKQHKYINLIQYREAIGMVRQSAL